MKDLIQRKRDGGAMTEEQIERWVRGVADGTVPDYQSAALLMAITLRGMSQDETLALTRAMLQSGRTLEWTKLGRPTVDKHSTGGVGDKVSLALAPWIAACGACVPMIAGRGLGHTGGTLDKLEAISGYRVLLSLDEFSAQLASVGVVIASQSDDLVPADRELYALRDVTATVESIPLIVASIVSKKFASGAAGVVFDVKCGGGAFMHGRGEAATLARELLRTSRALGQKARALLTDMEQPLGAEVGNACEAEEAFALLRGEGPEDLASITRDLGAAMLVLAGVAREKHEAEARLGRALDSGEAVRRAEKWIEAQGGDPSVVTDPTKLPRAEVETAVVSPRSGYVARIDARAIGDLLVAMGGGRAQKEDLVDPAVGIRLVRKSGAKVDSGETVAILRAHEEAPQWADAAGRAFSYADAPPAPRPLVLEEVSG